MGPIADHQLRICPPFWAAQVDLLGPVKVYVPGFNKNTRNRNVLEAKCWGLVFVCPVTRLTNIQVIEKSDSAGIIDGLTRLSCEIGVPKVVLIDEDSALVKAMREVEVDIVDTQMKVHTEFGIEFSICPVAGHHYHGQVERKIRSIQESLQESGLYTSRVHATGLQTIFKLVENQLNNMPLGYSYGRDLDNSPLLRMISPNMLRVGRSNERALSGPLRLPGTCSDMLGEVDKIYSSWFKIWNASYVPKLVQQPKWFRKDKDLMDGDIVMFQKDDPGPNSQWTLGTVDQVVRGRDNIIRRVIVKYQNYSESFPRMTDRSIRSLVKVWSCDDVNVDEDLAALQKKLDGVPGGRDLVHGIQLAESSRDGVQSSCGVVGYRGSSCCDSHRSLGYSVREESSSSVLVGLLSTFSVETVDLGYLLMDKFQLDDVMEKIEEEEDAQCDGSLVGILTSLTLNLD